ncbi:MAG: hypothetical protein KKA10_01000, partial [Euryarchaeota archaeon]|nr:hypothetical protein [Euryarchaeota archaeon]MCG2736170.1 hypothetical protein [Candidatus Methanoperedenaceae archaeon]
PRLNGSDANIWRKNITEELKKPAYKSVFGRRESEALLNMYVDMKIDAAYTATMNPICEPEAPSSCANRGIKMTDIITAEFVKSWSEFSLIRFLMKGYVFKQYSL